MKQKFVLITFLVITLSQLNGFAQGSKFKLPASLPLVADDGIYRITVSENVNVILVQDKPENVGVKVSEDVLRKLKFSIDRGDLFLATAKELAADERLTVYVWVNDLENLTLKGNAVAVSRGILQSRNLHISSANGAAVSIKSKGKVWFDVPENYRVIKEKGYNFVHAFTTIQY